jgi:hypothetical protein
MSNWPKNSVPMELAKKQKSIFFRMILFCVAGMLLWSLGERVVKTIRTDATESIFAATNVIEKVAELNQQNVERVARNEDETLSYDIMGMSLESIYGDMLVAAKNVTHDNENKPWLEIQTALIQYVADLKMTHPQYNSDKASREEEFFASQSSFQKVLSAANDLKAMEKASLDAVYENEYGYFKLLSWAYGGLFLWVLLGLNRLRKWHTTKFRRIYNTGIHGALVIFLLAGSHLVFTVYTVEKNIEVAKSDALDSILSLNQAKNNLAMAYDNVAMFVLNDGEFSQARHREVANEMFDAVLVKKKTPVDLKKFSEPRTDEWSGALREAERNVTFDGEREAVAKAMQKFEVMKEWAYRVMETPSGAADAFEEGLLPYNAAKYAMEDVAKINKAHFLENIDKAHKRLLWMPFILMLMSILSVGLLYVFLRPRFEEFK